MEEKTIPGFEDIQSYIQTHASMKKLFFFEPCRKTACIILKREAEIHDQRPSELQQGQPKLLQTKISKTLTTKTVYKNRKTERN